MVQSISMGENTCCDFVKLTQTSKTSDSPAKSNISTDFEGIIERLTSEPTEKKKEEEELNKTLSEKLKEATSKITICPNCGAIYMGQEVIVCAKCHSDIEQSASAAGASSASQ